MTKIAISWCRRDQIHKDALMHHLKPAIRLFTDVKVEWWEDSRLTCGEQLIPGILDRLDEADLGLLMVSRHYLTNDFIRTHELPRFVGGRALPVQLTRLPPFGSHHHDLGGLEKLFVFNQDGKSFAEQTGVRRPRFADVLAESIRRRILGLNGYQA